MKNTAVIIGVTLIALGGVALAASMDWIHVRFWTVIAIAAMALGALFHLMFLRSGQKQYGLLLPGAILLVYGCLFLVLSLNHESYFRNGLWALFLVGPGLGFLEMYLLGARTRAHLVPAGILLSLGISFFVSWLPVPFSHRLFFPALLLCAGVFTILYAYTPASPRRQYGGYADGAQSAPEEENGQAQENSGYSGIKDPHMQQYTEPSGQEEKETE